MFSQVILSSAITNDSSIYKAFLYSRIYWFFCKYVSNARKKNNKSEQMESNGIKQKKRIKKN